MKHRFYTNFAMAITFFVVASGMKSLAAPGDVVFHETFDTQEAFDAWEIDNVIAESRTWQFFNKTAAYLHDIDSDYEPRYAADDWLFSPAFTLDNSKVYEFRFSIGALTNYENSLRVALVKSMEQRDGGITVAEFVEVASEANGEYCKEFTVPENGTWRVALYCFSPVGSNRIEVDNIRISEFASVSVPARVSDLAVTAGEKGALNATVTGNAPDKTLGGVKLTSLSAIDIYRGDGDKPMVSLTPVTPGSKFSWTDNAAPAGMVSYRVVARNNEGESPEVSAEAWVGADSPSPVENLVAGANQDRTVNLTWNAPTTSAHGGYVDFDKIVYRITRNGELTAGAYDKTALTDATVSTSGNQQIFKWIVEAVYLDNRSEAAESNGLLCGQPLELPYQESFAGMQWGTPWVTDGSINDFVWELMPDDEEGEYEEVMSQDGDNGMLRADTKWEYEGATRIISPIFDFSGIESPVLTFWMYNNRSPYYDPDFDGEINDMLSVQLSLEGGDWKTVDNATFAIADQSMKWVKYEVFLPVGNASWGSFAFDVSIANDNGCYRGVYIDNINLTGPEIEHDLSATSLVAAQKRIDVGDKHRLHATVFNRGASTESSYSVELLRGDEAVATVEGTSVEAGRQVEFAFEIESTHAEYAQGDIEWRARVVMEGDENSDNDISPVAVTNVRVAGVAAPAGVEASLIEGGGVALSWLPCESVEAVQPGTPKTVTDDFELYEPYIIENIGDWTMVDRDGATTLSSPRLNTYPHKGDPMAYQVYNPVDNGTFTDDNKDYAVEPHSGEQYLICPSTDYPAENDDWLITPRLDGRAHEISFYAKGATFDLEWINVYTSTTDRHPDSFEKLNEEDHIAVWDGWAKYSFEVPDGTRYFAVRCVRRCVMLMIDDFTYNEHDGSPDVATFEGYNVYDADGNRLNDGLLTETGFIDPVGTAGKKYKVTAVYAEGESEYSEVEATSRLNSVGDDSGAPAEYFNLQGVKVSEKNLRQGIYIVRQGSSARKIRI